MRLPGPIPLNSQCRTPKRVVALHVTPKVAFTDSGQVATAEIDKEYPWHTYPETLEYAGVRHITRGTYRRVRR